MSINAHISIGLWILFMASSIASFGQLEVHHSSIGNAAIKSGFSGQVLVSHSSGRSGVNGTRSTDHFLVFEGFQQPMTSQVRKTESKLQC